MEKTPEIVLTGGPCGGKTTALAHIQGWLMDRGFRVFLVPEIPTMFIQGGVPDIVSLATKKPREYRHFQLSTLKTQMALRDRYQDLASGFRGQKVVIYDRGPMDIKAYISESEFRETLLLSRFTTSQVRDSFDGVIHLVTAADGAEEHYTRENNSARTESPEDARRLDKRTRDAWIGNPHVKIIGNDPPGFDLKMKRATAAVARILGIPVPLEIERKFLLDTMPDLSGVGTVQKVLIEQIYLEGPESEQVRIRRRMAEDGSSVYYRTLKSATGTPGVRNEQERIIDAIEYASLAKHQKAGTRTLLKMRHCFIWHQQYFELDVFSGHSDRIYLEIELTEANDRVELPPFAKNAREVTDLPGFSNYELAMS